MFRMDLKWGIFLFRKKIWVPSNPKSTQKWLHLYHEPQSPIKSCQQKTTNRFVKWSTLWMANCHTPNLLLLMRNNAFFHSHLFMWMILIRKDHRNRCHSYVELIKSIKIYDFIAVPSNWMSTLEVELANKKLTSWRSWKILEASRTLHCSHRSHVCSFFTAEQ